jgi:hypothetical protein
VRGGDEHSATAGPVTLAVEHWEIREVLRNLSGDMGGAKRSKWS